MRAFTLIEMLVVISVIGLLVAILLPALQKSRTAAHQVGSLSNIRQITLAQHSYAADHKQSLPFLRQKSISSVTGEVIENRWGLQWSRTLHGMGYLSDTSVFWSPGRERAMDHGPEDVRPEWTERPNPYTFESVGYGMSVGAGGSYEADHILLGAPLPLRLDESSAPPPSNMLLLAETFAPSTTSVGSINGTFVVTASRYTQTSSYRLFNYNGAVVRSYVDGRASAAATTASRLAGYETYVNNNGMTALSANDLGWNLGAPPPSGQPVYEGSYAGYWVYNNPQDVNYHAPFYSAWRTRWYRGMRTVLSP